MSSMLGPLGLFHTATGDGHATGDHLGLHSDSAGVRGQEPAGTRPPSEDDFSEFFDWSAYETEGTDVTAQTDASGGDKPAVTSPEALVGSPAAEQSDHPMPDASPPGPQPPIVWPTLGPFPPRHDTLRLEQSPSCSPSPPAEMHPESQDRTTPLPKRKGTRIVKSPEATARVRKRGSCYCCSMNKKKCDDEDVCEPCSKRPLSASACIRTRLFRMVSSKLARWNWVDLSPFMLGNQQFVEHPICIYYSDNAGSPGLDLRVRVELPNQTGQPSQHRLAIVPSPLPQPDAIRDWMEKQILAESKTDFETEMDKLLVILVRQPGARTQPGWELLSNILTMACMSKLWSCKQLYFRQNPGSEAYPFDLRFASILEYLRHLAGREISLSESKVLAEVDKYRAKKETPVTKWLVLWQLMLIYRRSLGWVLEQQQTGAAPLSMEVMPFGSRRHEFREATRKLFDGTVITYSELFDTKDPIIPRVRKAGPEALGQDCAVNATYQRVWEALPDFYRRVLRQESFTDNLFIACIVNRELEIMEKNGMGGR